jgi:hypothetical protein
MPGVTFYVFLILALLGGASGCSVIQLRKVHTEHLGQLTGTLYNQTQNIGITGTDLGVSFMEPAASRKLIFLFGDSWTRDRQRWDQDSAAWTLNFLIPNRNKMPRINWFSYDQFAQVRIPNVALGGMNVPVEGLALHGRTYIFVSTGWDGNRHCCSALAHTEGLAPDFDELILDHEVQTDKFVNISAFVEGDTIWLFASGPYRQSDVYLARVHQSQIADRNSWQYYRGTSNGNAMFGPNETSAQPVVASRCVGELSVRKHPQLGYLMLYNCGGPEGAAPRGIHLRRADNPWGPWAPAINIFDPSADRGYGYFMHQKASVVGYDDGLAEPGLHTNINGHNCPGDGWREECWGGEYGPYLVPQWFTTTPDGGFSIMYTLSSWVPYQVHLMRTVLAKRKDPRPQPPRPRGQDLPPAKLTNGDFGGSGTCSLGGWQSLGDTFGVFKGNDGRCRMTTFTVAKGDNATGALFQDFTVDASTKALRFLVHGGEATVRLHRGPEVVRETRGRSGHAPRNSPETIVCWQLSEYAGESLRVAIFDGKTGPWGFIGVMGFEFLNHPC